MRSISRRRILLVVLPCIAALVLTLHSCVTMRMSRGEVAEYFDTNRIDGELHELDVDGRHMAWVEAGNVDGPLIVFVHGSPGSLSAFLGFFNDRELLAKARLIAVDRPGYGYSELGRSEASLAEQARLIAAVIEQYRGNKPVIVVGHSYGGPVIARLAMDRPDLIDGLVLVAASIDPNLEPKHWYQRPLASPPLRWLVPRPLRACNEEIIGLEPELRAMLPRWGEITMPVTVIQGESDTLVPPANAEFAKRMMVNAKVELVEVPGMDHFIPWKAPELIRDAIVRQLDGERSASLKSAH